MADRLRMEVPFPVAGEGITLKLSNPDIRQLEGHFGKTWWKDIIEAFDRWDLDALQKCVTAAARKDGEKVKVDVMTLEVPLVELFTPMTNALYVCVHGKTYSELLLDHMKATQEGRDEANPTNGSNPENSSPS